MFKIARGASMLASCLGSDSARQELTSAESKQKLLLVNSEWACLQIRITIDN